MANRQLTVKVGTYQKDGQTKNLYRTCGEEIVKQDGGKFLKLYSWFDFSRVKADDDGSFIVNIQDAYDPEKKPGAAPAAKPTTDMEVPF